MHGDPIRVTVRFSNGNPNPRCPDAAQDDPRGMAVKFYLPDGSTTDIACQSWPVFLAGTPEGFLGLLRAQAQGPAATEQFLAGHPDIDASKAWPADREWADMGLIEVTGPDAQRERDGDILVNDPIRVTDGIELSDDPILRIRTYVYGESVRRRSGATRPVTL
jgi:catalase